MRARLRLLVAATTSAVVLAFLIPLLLLVRQLASDRASAAALQDSQQIALVASTGAQADQLASLIDGLTAGSGRRITIVLPDGTVVGEPLGKDPNLTAARRGSAFSRPFGEHLAQYVPAVTADGTLVVRTLVPDSELHKGVTAASVTITMLGLALMAGALLTADRLARSFSAPFHELADAADRMREGHLDLRVPEEGLPEAVAVGRALNRLAARVEELLVAERDAVADLSHRLRTPVTALRLDADGVHDAEIADRLRGHVEHLERTIDAIVADARRPIRAAVTVTCDAAAVVRERVVFWSALAEDQGRILSSDVPRRRVLAGIDAVELADVVDVLIDNVFAHTPDGVPFAVSVDEVPGKGVALTVSDAGPGLPSADVVERGASGGGGTGLGLDIARRAAAASRGSIELGRSPMGGARVRVLFGRPRG